MSATGPDAVVIGGGVSGLAAACYLSRAGLRVLVLEANPFLGGLCAPRSVAGNARGPQTDLIYALDRRVLDELGLTRRLRFAVRDLPLVGLRQGGNHIVLGRNPHAAAPFIRPHSERDARAYARYRRSLFAEARAARRVWWDGAEEAKAREGLHRLSFLSAGTMLESWFESDAMTATLAFDATADGVSIEEAPSALNLLWRAAQENSGLQSACGVLRGGSFALVTALHDTLAASGAEIRTSARVVEIIVRDGNAAGVVLESGEEIGTPLILSSLSWRRCNALLPPAETGIGKAVRMPGDEISTAQLWLSLEGASDLDATFSAASRFIVAERLQSYVAAHEASRDGKLPSEILYEATCVPVDGGSELSILARPLPQRVKGGWKEAGVLLLARVIASLSTFDRGIKDRIRHMRIVTPDDLFGEGGEGAEPSSVLRLTGSPRSRVETEIRGLLLCGADAEPVSAISCRAARTAARLAITGHKRHAEGAAA